MKQERGRDEVTLEDAIAAVRDDEAPAAVADAAAARVWQRLAPHAADGRHRIDAIRGCADVQALLPAHRRGELRPARALLVEDHLRECAACRAAFREPDGPRLAVLPWRPASHEATPEAAPLRSVRARRVAAAGRGPRRLVRAAVAFFAVPPGSRATVQSVSGALQRLDAGQALPLAPGRELGEGEAVRTARGSRAVLRLRDGSSVEMGERAELTVTARGQDTTIHLERGSIIVRGGEAPHRPPAASPRATAPSP